MAFLALGLMPLFAYAVEMNRGLPNRDIVWSFDCNPMIPLIGAKRIFLEGWYSAFSDFHKYVLLVFITSYTAFQFAVENLSRLEMVGGYPYGLAEFETIFSHFVFVTRGVSVAMLLGTVFIITHRGKLLFPDQNTIFCVLILGFLQR